MLCPGFQLAVESCKSFILSSAAREGRLDTRDACRLALLEVRHQVAGATLSLSTSLSHIVFLPSSHYDAACEPFVPHTTEAVATLPRLASTDTNDFKTKLTFSCDVFLLCLIHRPVNGVVWNGSTR